MDQKLDLLEDPSSQTQEPSDARSLAPIQYPLNPYELDHNTKPK